MLELSDIEFEELVRKALDGLPGAFRPHLEEVGVVLEDAPEAELLRELGMDPEEETLFGLYQGRPLTERSIVEDIESLPAKISIYRQPLLYHCGDLDELVREIQITVIHEIAHHFGIDEGTLEELGWD
jgi:predicted Zn-dependent protease with MMP-like domain